MFGRITANPCVFIHKDKHSIIFFHVDDLIVVGEVNQFEELFLARFPNSSAHDPDTILGMDLTIDHEHIKLKEFSKLNINYRTHTGILNYLACRTRPDLAPAVSILSSFNHAPGLQHWKQVVHCWKYLAETIQFGLTLQPNPQDDSGSLQHFTDATWADDLENRLSRSGSICFWKACPVAWNSKKQKNITLSSTEAELNALSDGVQENQWIKFLVEERWNEKLQPTHFYVDNQGLIEKLKIFGSNSKTKHINIKMKMLQEMKKNNEILFTLIPSEEMIADALTKPRNHESLSRLQEKCFLVLVHYSSSCGGC
ncbi:hypothetical protein VP01_6320g1 [Puccinia sorghi]|uniref:Reverse transcriptase Ty1/copia-type domain-containing protein n=1 Tax=Puccinia sorghi TaxID=27349 RepID=A0A0L6UG85_9BASI|nr:hypothetical protein VP01_6320g1 [Puccinia sorghi]